MTTTRELLEGCAKATGWQRLYEETDMGGKTLGYYVQNAKGQSFPFNPHTDDGDCARMEVLCDIDVTWLDDSVVSARFQPEAGACEFFSRYNRDKNAARRMASCRAAFEISKEM